MTDTFASYETGLTELLERLGKEHSRYTEALTLQSRLLENVSQSRQYSDTETRRAERAQIVDALNRLALKTVEVSFNELCGMGRGEPVLTTPIEPPDTPSPPSPHEPTTRESQTSASGKRGGIIGWYKNLPTAQQVAIIVALIGLVGTLAAALIGVMPELLSRPIPTPTAIPTHTPTSSPSPTATSTPSLAPTAKASASLVTATPTERLTPTPLPTITPALTVAATSALPASPTPTTTCPISIGAEIIVDDAGPGFKKFGNEDYWYSCPYAKAIGGRMQWTFGVTQLDNYGLWCPQFPCPGWYEVLVYIPNSHATVEDARYRMHCREDLLPQTTESDIVYVKQAKEENSWVSLGRSWFELGSGD